MDVKERVQTLRTLMKEKNIDMYYIPNEDDHLSSEYTAAYYGCKSYMSGFTGESGCMIVTQDFAGLWTDGRYFTQAEIELEGTGVQLMRLKQVGVLDPVPFMLAHIEKGQTIGFDGSVVSAGVSLQLAKALKDSEVTLDIEDDLVNTVWGKERPLPPQEKLFVLDETWVKESAAERIARVRNEMEKNQADVLILTLLEDPCWMLDIRGNDIPCTPVAYAFAMVSKDSVKYYVSKEKVTKEVQVHLEKAGVTICDYEDIAKDLEALQDTRVWCDLHTLNTKLYNSLAGHGNSIINSTSPVVMFRAIKNDVEIAHTLEAHKKDGVAMVKFIKWVKENVGKGDMTEVSAQNHLYALRKAQENYIEPSFHTISAYQANGAMMHYSATEEKHSRVDPKGFLLVDSGGTYKDGSTDITRTIACGPLTEEEKKLYTLVLKGHLDLAHARFLKGTAGNNLDILARRPMWNILIDYQCGTGHGVGHVLGVHEGPHGIRWGLPTAQRPGVVLEEGMIVTDEPGIYLPHKLGIRIENELLVVKAEDNFYGEWLEFKDITYCPYELDAIDTKYLDEDNIEQINAYHEMVYNTLSPRLNEEEKTWLAHATRKITK